MQLIKDIDNMRGIVEKARGEGLLVGLVPTMGYFHEGHLQLMREARKECDLVVVSLFVNPTQFAEGEDLEEYPRDLERDSALAEEVGVDYLFNPEPEQVYPEGYRTSVKVEDMSEIMCGRFRPTHFGGVTTIVCKLFNMVPAQKAYFGQKDAQQLAIVRRMAEDLNFRVDVVAVPTVREPDGLAMSSRNVYLTREERERATVLYRSLVRARELVESAERDAGVIEEQMRGVVGSEKGVDLEYIAICDNIYLEPLTELSGEVLIALAARIGRARLIDNMLFELD